MHGDDSAWDYEPPGLPRYGEWGERLRVGWQASILRFMDTGTRRRSAQLRLRRLCACSRARLLLLCLQLDTTEYRPYEYEYAPLDGNAVQGG